MLKEAELEWVIASLKSTGKKLILEADFSIGRGFLRFDEMNVAQTLI